MDSAKNGRWIIPYKKFSRLRVKRSNSEYSEICANDHCWLITALIIDKFFCSNNTIHSWSYYLSMYLNDSSIKPLNKWLKTCVNKNPAQNFLQIGLHRQVSLYIYQHNSLTFWNMTKIINRLNQPKYLYYPDKALLAITF